MQDFVSCVTTEDLSYVQVPRVITKVSKGKGHTG